MLALRVGRNSGFTQPLIADDVSANVDGLTLRWDFVNRSVTYTASWSAILA